MLALSGELDAASAPELEQHLNEALAEPHAHVTLDLSELEFVDSAGVSVLIKAKQDAESNGRTLVLGRATEQVQRVFALVSGSPTGSQTEENVGAPTRAGRRV